MLSHRIISIKTTSQPQTAKLHNSTILVILVWVILMRIVKKQRYWSLYYTTSFVLIDTTQFQMANKFIVRFLLLNIFHSTNLKYFNMMMRIVYKHVFIFVQQYIIRVNSHYSIPNGKQIHFEGFWCQTPSIQPTSTIPIDCYLDKTCKQTRISEQG